MLTTDIINYLIKNKLSKIISISELNEYIPELFTQEGELKKFDYISVIKFYSNIKNEYSYITCTSKIIYYLLGEKELIKPPVFSPYEYKGIEFLKREGIKNNIFKLENFITDDIKLKFVVKYEEIEQFDCSHFLGLVIYEIV